MSNLNYVEKLAEAEDLGEAILLRKQQVIDFDRRRNGNREALGVFRRQETKEKKIYLCLGDIFIKTPTPVVKTLIEKEQQYLTEEIDKARDEMKDLSTKLNKLEGVKNPTESFDLTALSKHDRMR